MNYGCQSQKLIENDGSRNSWRFIKNILNIMDICQYEMEIVNIYDDFMIYSPEVGCETS